MKAINYFATIIFGVLGVACGLTALVALRFELGCLAGICFTLAWVAWGDYKKCCNDEAV